MRLPFRAAAFGAALSLLAVTLPAASAEGTTRVEQTDGSVQIYQDVSMRLDGPTIWIQNANHKAMLEIKTASCSFDGKIKRCFPRRSRYTGRRHARDCRPRGERSTSTSRIPRSSCRFVQRSSRAELAGSRAYRTRYVRLGARNHRQGDAMTPRIRSLIAVALIVAMPVANHRAATRRRRWWRNGGGGSHPTSGGGGGGRPQGNSGAEAIIRAVGARLSRTAPSARLSCAGANAHLSRAADDDVSRHVHLNHDTHGQPVPYHRR